MPGLESVGAEAPVEQRVAVALADVVVGKALLGEVAVVLRKVRDQPQRQPGEVARRHQVVRLGPAAGVGEHAVGEAELAAATGHLVGEGALGSRQGFGDDDAGVVAGLDDDAADEVFDRDPRVDADEHLRAAHPPRFFAHRKGVGQLQPAVGQTLEQHVQRHQLAHRGRRRGNVGVLLEQHRVRGRVDQQRAFGRRLQRRRRRGAERHMDRRAAEQGEQGRLHGHPSIIGPTRQRQTSRPSNRSRRRSARPGSRFP